MRSFIVHHKEVDLDRAEVRGPDGIVSLTPNEVRLLGVLARHAGQVVQRDVLLREALGYRVSATTRALDQAVLRLRRKIEPEPHSPRWLLAEPNVGYRLELDPAPAHRLLGRSEELRHLCALLDQGLSVVVVGLPGSGRRALIEAAAQSGSVRATPSMTHAAAMPQDPGVAVIRIGSLTPEASRALLVRWVLELRRAADLPEADAAAAAAAAARAGHHPAALRQLAEASVTSSLSDAQIATTPEVLAHVAALSADVHQTLVRCAPFPGAFKSEEVGVSVSDLRLAWDACVLETVTAPEDGRCVRVPQSVRAALPILPAHAASQAFVAGVIETLVPTALAVIGRIDEAAQMRLLRDKPRVEAALALGRPQARVELLPVVLAHWVATRTLLEDPTEASGPLTADQAICLDLLKAVFAEQQNTSVRNAGAVHWRRALTHTQGTQTIRAFAMKFGFFRAMWASQYEERDGLLSNIEALCIPESASDTRALFHHCRGLCRIRDGDSEGAREDLLQALSLYGPTSNNRHSIAENLAAEAARDGRAGESLAWLDRVDLGRSPRDQEPYRRQHRVILLQLVGRLDDADDEIERIERQVGHRAWQLGGSRAAQALLRGQLDDAVILAQEGRADHPRVGQASLHSDMVLGWARVAQGLGDEALAVVAAIPGSALTHTDYHAQVDLLRAAALARSSSPGGVAAAIEVLEGLPDPPLRWWPMTRKLVEALVAGDEAAGLACVDQLSKAGLAHLLASFAHIALLAPDANPRGVVSGNSV